MYAYQNVHTLDSYTYTHIKMSLQPHMYTNNLQDLYSA